MLQKSEHLEKHAHVIKAEDPRFTPVGLLEQLGQIAVDENEMQQYQHVVVLARAPVLVIDHMSSTGLVFDVKAILLHNFEHHERRLELSVVIVHQFASFVVLGYIF